MFNRTGSEATAENVLKVDFSIGSAHGATAIADARGNHSYGQLLRSSFQLSQLLQSLLPGERPLPVTNTCIEAHGDGVNEIQHDGSKTLGVCKLLSLLVQCLRCSSSHE